MEFKKLLEPITINHLLIKNRIVMPAMALFYTNDYSLTDPYKTFYMERAMGGVGLMIMGPMAVDKVGSTPLMLGLFDDGQIAPLRALVDEIHAKTDAKIGVQLMQQGRYASSEKTGMTPIAPSAVRSVLTGEIPREMTKEDVEEVQDAFVKAALRAKEAGFDYVELIAGGGYLIGEFLSPVTNRRTDEYGGTIEKRIRFGIEVIKKVRQALGDDFAMGIRVSGHDFMKGGNTNKESLVFCVEAEKAGVNAISVTGGWHETNVPQITGEVPPGAYVYLARNIKEKVGVPVFASNRMGNPFVAEKVLRSGSADMICWARPLLADPLLPMKVQTGRSDEITPCICCNQGCFDSIVYGVPISCVVNPRVGREADTKVIEAAVKKKIYVAGGGPAGMEFAVIAAKRGHDVTLYEKSGALGGQIKLIGSLPGKIEFLGVVESLKNGVKSSGVRVVLNTELTAEMVSKDQPDLLVVASGATPASLKVEGIDLPHVVKAWDVINGEIADIGKEVVVVGGSATGCETALLVAGLDMPDPETLLFLLRHEAEDAEQIQHLLIHSARKVTVVDPIQRLAGNVGPSTRWPLMKSLRSLGVALRPRTKLVKITKDVVMVETDSGTESIPADTVIIAAGSRSVSDLAGKIEPGKTELVVIGDAKEPRKITDAIREGFDAAMTV